MFTRTRHYLGPVPGRVVLSYDALARPDWIRVIHNGRVLAETPGYVSRRGGIEFDWRPPPNQRGEAYVVEVIVSSQEPRTEWSYRLSCPAGR